MSVGMLEHFRRGWQGQSFYTTGKSLTKYTVRVLETKRPRPNTIIRIFRIFEVIRVIKGIKAIRAIKNSKVISQSPHQF